MKNLKFMTLLSVIVMAAVFISAMPADSIMSKEGKATVINTTLLGQNIRGFRGQTPVKIYIQGKKVKKIIPLKNQETPKFFNKAQTLLSSYEGISVNKAVKMNVDGVSGATYSSKALKKNVQLGLQYYEHHK